MANVGFLHPTEHEYGEVLSETDSASKYGVQSTQSNQESGSTAELSVVDFDENTVLNANGMRVKAIQSGPLEDRHDNYRHPSTFNDYSLGVARVSVKDYDESPAVEKAKHEYWAPNYFDVISTNEDIDVAHDGHSDGEKLMHIAVKSVPSLVGFKAVYVAGRNDSTRTWSTYVQATDPELTAYSPTDNIAMSPTMVTVPNLGTLLFYFALDGNVPTGYKNQIIKIRITKDNGASWENYGSIVLEPFYGAVNMTGATRPYAYEKTAVLKASFADNKIVLGMILSGSETTTLPEDETVNCARILNLMVSENLGKSWATVPYEFLTSSIEGGLPNSAYLFGNPVAINGIPNTCAANFGLGYEPQSGKFALALHSTGNFDASSTDVISKWDNISWLYLYYNTTDDLMEWRSSKHKGSTYRLLDDYGKLIPDYSSEVGADYEVYDYTGTSVWSADESTLRQTANVSGPSYAGGQAEGGTHLIYNLDTDPTLNRTVGVRVKVYSGSGDTGTFGLGFCRNGNTDFYAVTIDTVNQVSAGTVNMYLKEVVSSTETTVASSGAVNWNADTWGVLEIRFYSAADIGVFFNDALVMTATFPTGTPDRANTFREGEIFLLTNDHTEVQFDDLGLLTDTSHRGLPGVCLTNPPTANRPRIGSNIDILVDHLNQAWICLDVTNVCVDVDSVPSLQDYRSNGIVMQKFRFDRSIQRVEGKFLAEDVLSAVFADNDDSHEDIGINFSICEYGVWTSHYDNTPRVYFSRATWHDGDPVWFVRRSDTSAELFGLVQRNQHVNRTMNVNFGSTYHAFVQGQSPQYTGWELSPGFTFTSGADESILKITQDGTGYFMQEYKHVVIAPSTNTERSVPIRYFDYVHRGAMAYAILRSPDDNADSSYRGVLEMLIPRITTGLTNSVDDNYVRFRVSSKDAPNEYYVEESNGIGGWNGLGSVLTPKFSPKTWHELLVYVVPSNVTGGNPEISAYVKTVTDTEWETIVEGVALTSLGPAGVGSRIKWGCFDSPITTKNAQEYKFCGYSDTCFIDPTVSPIRGETVPSGGEIFCTKGITVAISGGNLREDDEWLLTDLDRREYDKSNIFARPSAEWRSANDSANKQIVIDMKHDFIYDTIVLIGANCQSITVESNDTNVWTSPDNSVTIDMTKTNHLQYEKYAGKDYIVKAIGLSYKDGSLVGERFICEDTALGAYRIRSNIEQYIIYEADTLATIPVSGIARYLDILSQNIALKFTSRFKDRYFRITFNKGSFAYPTPEGYFKLGMFAAGIFDELQDNPEYPEEKLLMPNRTSTKLASGVTRDKKEGNKTLQRTLNFNAIKTEGRLFAEQLKAIHAHSEGLKPVFYVPNIGEFSESGYTYTFEVVPCLTQPVIDEPVEGGMLTNMKFVLDELL